MITAWLDDRVRIQWEDEAGPFLHGQIGLANFTGCHTAYEEYTIGK